MKQNKIFTLLISAGIAGLLSCNNSSGTTATSEDSIGASNTTDNNVSTSNYSAYADEIEKNSASGYYINPKSGKAYGKLSVNRETGEITDENNEPVW